MTVRHERDSSHSGQTDVSATAITNGNSNPQDWFAFECVLEDEKQGGTRAVCMLTAGSYQLVQTTGIIEQTGNVQAFRFFAPF